MMSKTSRCWGSNDGFIWEERTAFIIRCVFAKGADSQGGVTCGFDFAEGVTSEHLRGGLRKCFFILSQKDNVCTLRTAWIFVDSEELNVLYIQHYTELSWELLLF